MAKSRGQITLWVPDEGPGCNLAQGHPLVAKDGTSESYVLSEHVVLLPGERIMASFEAVYDGAEFNGAEIVGALWNEHVQCKSGTSWGGDHVRTNDAMVVVNETLVSPTEDKGRTRYVVLELVDSLESLYRATTGVSFPDTRDADEGIRTGVQCLMSSLGIRYPRKIELKLVYDMSLTKVIRFVIGGGGAIDCTFGVTIHRGDIRFVSFSNERESRTYRIDRHKNDRYVDWVRVGADESSPLWRMLNAANEAAETKKLSTGEEAC